MRPQYTNIPEGGSDKERLVDFEGVDLQLA
jgi:hypothetical protein